MKKGAILSAALVLSLAASSAAYADLPRDTVVIGNNGYSIRSLFDSSNYDNIKQDLLKAVPAADSNSSMNTLLDKAKDSVYYAVYGANCSGLSSFSTGQNLTNAEIPTKFQNGINYKDSTGKTTTIANNAIQTAQIYAQGNYTVDTYVYGEGPDKLVPDFKNMNLKYNDGTSVDGDKLTAEPVNESLREVPNKVGKTDLAYVLDDGYGHTKDITITVNVKPISEMKLSEIINEANTNALSTVFGDVYLNNRSYTWDYLKANLDTLKDQIALSANKQFEQLSLSDLSNVTLKLERSNGDKFEFTIDSAAFLENLPAKISEITGVTGFGQYTVPLTTDSLNEIKSEIDASQRKISDYLTTDNLDKAAEKLSSVTINGKTYSEDYIKDNLDKIKQDICDAVGKTSFDDITFADLKDSANAKLSFTSGIFGRIFEIGLPSIK